MFTRFIQHISRLFARGIVRKTKNPSLNVSAKPSRNSAQHNGRDNGTYPNHRLNQNGSFQNRTPVDGYRHNAERLLRDGHLRIAITGFNDTAFDVSVMRRHDSPQLAMAVSDLPCKIKMVDQRNITAGLLAAIKSLDDGSPGRRGIVLITSGAAESGKDHLQQLAEKAAAVKIGIHVICLGIRTDDPTGAPRISTKDALGYGGLRMVGSYVQLLPAIREAFQGLTPAFGMRGTNKAVILLDCSETMVEAYRDTTRIDMVISALGKFLEAPLVRISDAVTGVGKTLIARYLHKRSGFSGRPLRISIPEYLGKEDMFEYDLFGYMRGAYTDAKEADHGLLLANAGGVVFLDEIGEANAMLQAKLLAYLDDYRVRPRRWKGDPFFCPTLIVAATNRDLNAMAKKKLFREDLLTRFTDHHVIPPLRDRMEDLNFILDCLLQSEAINPEKRVTEIGSAAVVEIAKRIKSQDFKGNFRELEMIMRVACQTAAKDGRAFVCSQDVLTT